MKPKSGYVHVFDIVRSIKSHEYHPKSFGMVRLNAGHTSGLKELF